MKNENWTRSSFCNADSQTGNCAEVARAGTDEVKIRDAAGSVVSYTNSEWDALRDGMKNGDFDNV